MKKTHQDRMTGTFYTPDIFVEEAHRYIEKEFGINWKEEYIVFDNSAGGFNLTKNHKFKELYCSTLEQEDIDRAIENNINPEAVKFQFDFLNDDTEKLPDGLKEAINSNKKIIIFMNPPYASAANMKFKDNETKTKKGVSKTKMSELMKKEKWGGSSNLYTQFLYRCFKLNELNNNIELCFFVKTNYKTGPSLKNFRKNFYSKYQFKSGFVFNAKYFAGCSSDWSIDFSIWRNGVETRDELESDIVDIKNDKIEKIGTKVLYNLDNKLPASEWVRQEVKGLKTVDGPQMSSGLKVKQTGRGKRIAEGQYRKVKPNEEVEFIGCSVNGGNNVFYNGTNVMLLSEAFSNWCGISITPDTINKVVVLFNAKKSINVDDINARDEYIAPEEEIEFIGYFANAGNNIYYNGTNTGMLSEAFSDGHGMSITQENIDKIIALFNARKSINIDDINARDEYIAPEEEVEFIGCINNDSNNIQQQNVIFLATSNVFANGNINISQENIDKVISLFNARKSIKGNWISDKDEYITPEEEIEFIGYFANAGNNIYYNGTNISILSDNFSNDHGTSISQENIDKAIALFNSRKSINLDYTNSRDEYIAPEETIQLFKFKIPNPLYVQYVNDSYVYSLFNNSSQQSSMNKVLYKEKEYKIKNEFFYMSKEEMKELAIKYNFNEMLEDISINGLKERFVYNRLLTTPLSPDALEVLEMGKELIRLTFEKRIELHREKPEYHLDCWDAGWYQLNKILKEYPEFKEVQKEFRNKYKAMEDRMRPLVYELGFLKK